MNGSTPAISDQKKCFRFLISELMTNQIERLATDAKELAEQNL